jgi:hypothetical protein
MFSCEGLDWSRVSCEVRRTGTASTEPSWQNVREVGGVGELDKIYIDEWEKKWDTEEMRSNSRDGELRRTPNTLKRVVSGTALGLATLRIRSIRSEDNASDATR